MGGPSLPFYRRCLPVSGPRQPELHLPLFSRIKSGVRKLLAILWRPAVSFWGCLGVLSLYFLSTGPFVWLVFNVRLPTWIAVGFAYLYSPISWAIQKSEVLQTIILAYVGLWVDIMAGVQPATPDVPTPDEPPFFVEFSGTLIGAWLVWNFVRWVNQRKVAAP